MIDMPHPHGEWREDLRALATGASRGDVHAALEALARMRSYDWQVVITSVEAGWNCSLTTDRLDINETDASFATAVGLAAARALRDG